MRILLIAISWFFLFLQTSASAQKPGTLKERKLKTLVVTGGHGFDRKEFSKVFDAIPDIEWKEAIYDGKKLNATEIFAGNGWKNYDVFVFYDMKQGLPEQSRKGISALTEAGKGIVMLHHTLAAHQGWLEYKRIVGGKYYTKKTREEGKIYAPSTYKHGLDIHVSIPDPGHPVTFGLKPYTIHDETYNHYQVLPGVKPLLMTNEPTSNKVIAWTHNYKNSRVVYIQHGHDSTAYQNPVFQTLIARSIRYVAGRPTTNNLPWQKIFNGKDLQNWTQSGGAKWSIKDGILTGRQGDGFAAGDLYSKEIFDNFEAFITFRVAWPANSGIWFRYQGPGKAYQADILEWKNPVCWTGSLYCGGYSKLFLSMNKDPSIVNKNGWNTYLIRAVNNHLTMFLNGHKVSDVYNDSSQSGRIGIQVHPGKQFGSMQIDIKDLMVRKI